MPDYGDKLTQKTWRIIGMASLGLAGIMSFHAVNSGFLGQTIRHVVHLFNEDAARAPSSSGLVHFIYWSIFLLIILTAMYMAVLDFRYIRVQFVVEKRSIFGRTLGSEEFRKSLAQKDKNS